MMENSSLDSISARSPDQPPELDTTRKVLSQKQMRKQIIDYRLCSMNNEMVPFGSPCAFLCVLPPPYLFAQGEVSPGQSSVGADALVELEARRAPQVDRRARGRGVVGHGSHQPHAWHLEHLEDQQNECQRRSFAIGPKMSPKKYSESVVNGQMCMCTNWFEVVCCCCLIAMVTSMS